MSAPKLHIPLLRFGKVYESLDAVPVKDHRTGIPLAMLSQANAGLARRDGLAALSARQAVRRTSHAEMLAVCRRAGELFLDGNLVAGSGRARMDAAEYVRVLSLTSGLTHRMCRENMHKLHRVLTGMGEVVAGLTRGLPLEGLDDGPVEQDGRLVSYHPVAAALAVVLPSNSPGVNSLWLPALGLRMPVLLKPGSAEPWTPWRLLAALREAGCPDEALGHYPGGHEVGQALIDISERAVVFGDASTVARWRHRTGVSVHGPGFSKVLIGRDRVDQIGRLLDLLIESVLSNGGRSCVNASTIVVPSRGGELAELLAERLAAFEPLPLDDPEARLAAFADRKSAEAIDTAINAALAVRGAVDVTARHRSGPRRVMVERSTFLCPTVIHCTDPEHPLARREYPFPCVSVVEVPEEEMPEWLGPTLALTAVTGDEGLRRRLIAAGNVDRLNLGEVATSAIAWDQPHEGNLFEQLFRRRAVQVGEIATGKKKQATGKRRPPAGIGKVAAGRGKRVGAAKTRGAGDKRGPREGSGA